MMVIADTTPINYLLLIAEIDLLFHLFSRIILPEGVLTELRHPKAPAVVRKWASALPAWVEVRHVRVPIEIQLQGLGPGESEAIALAEHLKPSLLLLDERKGYQVATERNIPVVGTLFVLEEAGTRGLTNLPRHSLNCNKRPFALHQSLFRRYSIAISCDRASIDTRWRKKVESRVPTDW